MQVSAEARDTDCPDARFMVRSKGNSVVAGILTQILGKSRTHSSLLSNEETPMSRLLSNIPFEQPSRQTTLSPKNTETLDFCKIVHSPWN